MIVRKTFHLRRLFGGPEEMSMKDFGPVLVTGASTGIGRSTTEKLAEAGYLVYGGARKGSDMTALASIPNVEPIRLDVTKPGDIIKAAETVKRRGKGLYGLVNNAGVGIFWPLLALDIEDMIQEFDVNVFGVHRVTEAMLPFLIRSKGRIVNVTSIGGLATSKYLGAYCMTKHALEAYSETLSRWLRKYGVKVSVVEPGTYRSMLLQKGRPRILGIAQKRKGRLFNQEVKELLDWYPRGAHRAEREPRPRDVPDAIIDALLSKRPRFRYCPCAYKGELKWAIEGPIVRSVQANLGGGKFAMSRKELQSLLDKTWDKEVRKAGMRRPEH